MEGETMYDEETEELREENRQLRRQLAMVGGTAESVRPPGVPEWVDLDAREAALKAIDDARDREESKAAIEAYNALMRPPAAPPAERRTLTAEEQKSFFEELDAVPDGDRAGAKAVLAKYDRLAPE